MIVDQTRPATFLRAPAPALQHRLASSPSLVALAEWKRLRASSPSLVAVANWERLRCSSPSLAALAEWERRR